MRSASDIIVMVIAVFAALFIFSQILPKIVASETNTADPTPKVQDWTLLVITDLPDSTSSPKKASTPVVSFTDPKDNCLLGEELVSSLGDHLNMSKITCNCNKTLGENEWKVCTRTECTQALNVIEVVNDEEGILAEQSYVLSVSASDAFTWVCIEVEARGDQAQ